METNIQLLLAAREALTAIQARNGGSRDATVRWVLEEHVREQEQRGAPKRLTHISTVLRHPLRPRDSRKLFPASPLRLRISSELAERARAVSLRLPGQPPRRGGRDYQARPLTDAVVTAIARRELIRDPWLAGLKPIIRHRAADGLWRLAVAATATKTEREFFTSAGGDPLATGDPVAEELLFNQVAWHSEWRLETLWELARHYLTGPGAKDAEQMLFDQVAEFEFAWTELLNRTGAEDDGLRLPVPSNDHEGRGGGAVWRAERAAEKLEFVDWLARQQGETFRRMTPPGWGLQVPTGWIGAVARLDSPELGQLRRWAEQRQALQFPMGSRVLVWPLSVTADGGQSPVPRMDVVVEQLNQMPAADAAELILRDHRYPATEEDDDYDEDELLDPEKIWQPLEVPAYTARTLGLIDEATFAELLRNAETATRDGMTEMLAGLPAEVAGDQELLEAMSFPALFNDLLYRRGVGGVARETKPRWIWPVVSLADQIVSGATPEVLVWLTQRLQRRYQRDLWGSEYRAWAAASARFNY